MRVPASVVVQHWLDLNDYDLDDLDSDQLNMVEFIEESPTYELKKIPIDQTNGGEEEYSRSLAQEYSTWTSAAPAIIITADGFIIDGYHRVHAAKLRNELEIEAYVGLQTFYGD